MTDGYTKTVLTVIAGALIYLCVVMTPFPAAFAQGTQRPGEYVGPAEVRIVDWKLSEPLPVQFERPVPVMVNNQTLRVTGTVQTERSSGLADRVVLVGWEQDASPDKPMDRRKFKQWPYAAGLPVSQQ